MGETENAVFFDFDAGMSKLFVAGDWKASDFDGANYKAEMQAAYASHSYLDNADIDRANNTFVVEQLAQVPSMDNATVRIKYYLSPYRPSSDFNPIKSLSFDRMGFFEVAPVLHEGGATSVYATKFNHNKPIVYALSSNTPAAYKQAVMDGVLYWNKAFGKEVVQVIDAPEGVYAPDYNYNMIQWVNNDQAGFAYADAQMDPMTGEILHAQVYLTTVFAYIGKQRALKILRKLDDNKDGNTSRLGLKGFLKASMCDMRPREDFRQMLEHIIENDISEEDALRMSQDYVREVTAHEIGHTMGLRHNFAGSLAANYALSERDALIEEYVESGHAPEGMIASSSVMDYQLFFESIVSGDHVAHGEEALDYDQKAIQALYNGEQYSNDEMPLFCTDSHIWLDHYADCQQFDIGSSYVEHAQWAMRDGLSDAPHYLMAEFIKAIAPMENNESVDLNALVLDVSGHADRILQSRRGARTNLVRAFSDSSKTLSVRRAFAKVDATNVKEIREQELNYLGQNIYEHGGIEAVLERVPSDFAETAYESFARVVESDAYRTGIGAGEQPYELCEDKIEQLKVIAKQYFITLQAELERQDLEIVGGTRNPAGALIEDHDVTGVLAEAQASRVLQYVFSQKEAPLRIEIETGDFVAGLNLSNFDPAGAAAPMVFELPQFYYPMEIRMLAASLINPRVSKSSVLMTAEAVKYRDFANELKASLYRLSSPVMQELGRAEDVQALLPALRWAEQNWPVYLSLFRPWDVN
jgi:hypothetical protein